ncbi:LacI family transcriptional regulator [Bifidobacterium lemurum]|uniref:LacI family transcriptional regulator n=1 Tax=Bifidobacterium lemurum TaxID=1603886 RepID=A0A261FW33_9BIFI|nr:LacI family DNA-binding transcriptional regulator [Bifidobacterium lemurum]OZG63185.1 LacI family transcriptional regulator [Bifidobacterium lemurum]QOL33509.1 LacI family DNA-binding transcriptional regulator [Bifidobacterium lemurum]
MVTIRDVAKAAGVSKSTVSYVLNNDPRITATTEAKVRRAIEELGYSVNHAARSLSSSRTWTIGISVAPDAGGYYSAAAGVHMYALARHASDRGYEALFVDAAGGARSIREAVASKRVDGVVVMDVSDDDPRIDMVLELGVPAVVFGSPDDCLGLDVVDSDYEREAVDAVRYLHELGRHDVVLFSKPEQLVRQRMGYVTRFNDAFVREARRLGMRVHVEAPEQVDSDPLSVVERAMRTYGDVNGVALFNEPVVMAAPRLFSTSGCGMCDERGVIAVAPRWICLSMSLPFATIQTDVDRLSGEVIDTLVSRIEDPGREPVRRLVAFPVIEPR